MSVRQTTRSPRRLIDIVRRKALMRLDHTWVNVNSRIRPTRHAPYDGQARLALITVNFSTTGYLKLMLATLAEQQALERITRVIIVDNGSRDGGIRFIRELAERVPRIDVVENRHFVNHARGMRSGARALDRLDRHDDKAANTLLFCDTDIVFRAIDALGTLIRTIESTDASLVGEFRGPPEAPNIQASFVAVRRDAYARRDVSEPFFDGAPTAALQRDIVRAGLTAVPFASNRGGYILHRGRAGVEAAHLHRPGHYYASVERRNAHYMGVENGEAIWREIEQQQSEMVAPGREEQLIQRLELRFSRRSD